MGNGINKENQIPQKHADFIDAMEVVYAVLLAWGFARVVEKCIWDLDYILSLLISGLVLIRFFFAASHNLAPLVVRSKGDFVSQRVLFIWDIPLLVFHSFIYYRMCFVLSEYKYLEFYKLLSTLLFINVLWLFTTNRRRKLGWCSKWLCNNSFHLLAIIPAILYFKDNTFLFFYIILSNCLWDFFLSAPDYLFKEFNDKLPSIRKWTFCLLSLYLLPMIFVLFIITSTTRQALLLMLGRAFQ